MQFVNNGPEQIEIRKSQNTLIVVGTGIILFGIWTMVKMLGMLFLFRKETIETFRQNFNNLSDLSDRAIFWGVAVVLLLLLAVFLCIRAYVGLSAIAEGRGKRKSSAYLIFAIAMIVSGVWSVYSECLALWATTDAPVQVGAFSSKPSVSAVIIEVTSMIMMIQMVISAVKIRKLNKAEAGKGQIDAA